MPLYPLLHHVLARGGEQGGSAPFVHRVLQKRLDRLDAYFRRGPVRVDGLLRLIRRDPAGVHGVDPGPVVLWRLEPGFVALHPADEDAGEEDLGELGAGVEGVWAHVGVDFREGGEACGGQRGAVEVGGLQD